MPESYTDFGETIAEVFQRYVDAGWSQKEIDPVILERLDILTHFQPTHFTSTISDERGEELQYNHKNIGEYVKGGSIAQVIANLWLKRDLSETALDILNTVIILLADH